MKPSCFGGRALVLILACWLLHPVPVLATICPAKLESGLAREDEGGLSLLHAHAKRKVGQASLGAAGKVEVRSKVPDRSDAAMPSQVLEEAAMAAVALAVAEETAAAKAIGGGSDGRLLASTRLSDTHLLEDDEEKAVEQQVERAARLAGSVDLMTSRSASLADEGKTVEPGEPYQSLGWSNKTRPGSSNKTNNPFASYSNWSNPFVNPFFNPFASNHFAIPTGIPTNKDSVGHWYSGVVVHVIIASIIFVIAAGAFSLCCGFEEAFEGSDSSASEEESSDGLFGWKGRRRKAKNYDGMVDAVKRPDQAKPRNCCCSLFNCMCCCSWRMYQFMAIATICTIIGGYILWQADILQPLLAQLLLYAYIVILVVSFVVVLFWELVSGLTSNMDKVSRTVGKFGDGFNLFGGTRSRNTVGEKTLSHRY